jgi:hypothetical protein
MKQMLLLGCVCAASMVALRAEENFSKAVRAEDFSAAGLAKLSPDELARLDALVRDFKSGALLAAKREAAAADPSALRSDAARTAPVDAPKEKKNEGGLLAKAKVLLAPGTDVEYAAIESRIAGDFTGWDGKAIFTLENGQRWQLANAGRYYTPALSSPKVKIVPASMGGFWMTIEGVNQRVKVVPLGGGK